jgi:hypothetical protein
MFLYNSYFGDEKEEVECLWCKWKGTLKQAHREYYSSPMESWWALAGREGWIWKCPKCGMRVHEEWDKIS